ncbi:MAG: BMP family ABC transporter substrate-binding protein [Desulfobacterales bacterium]|nr:BMP family ABC transporter substrate-binding protein [Desulfobacterales bacterium]
MMKRILVVLLALTMVFSLASGVSAKTLKVGLVTDVGKIDDKTFNEFAFTGIKRAARDFDIQISFIETQQPTDYDKNIEQFVNEGYDVVVTVGFMLGDATKRMAEKYPDKKFIIIDFAYDPPVKNILGLVFAENESGFMAGALAGLMTKENTIGIVAGMEIPPVIKFRKGYEAGAKYVNPKCEVLGVYIDSFIDPARGKTAALSQMEEGADVIFGAGGLTGSGGVQGAAAEGAWVIGVDQDEYYTTFKEGKVKASDKIISSAMKRVDNAVHQAIGLVVEGKFKGGLKVFDITNDGIGLAPFHEAEDKIPASVKAKLEEIKKDLKAGKIKVPGL